MTYLVILSVGQATKRNIYRVFDKKNSLICETISKGGKSEVLISCFSLYFDNNLKHRFAIKTSIFDIYFKNREFHYFLLSHFKIYILGRFLSVTPFCINI